MILQPCTISGTLNHQNVITIHDSSYLQHSKTQSQRIPILIHFVTIVYCSSWKLKTNNPKFIEPITKYKIKQDKTNHIYSALCIITVMIKITIIILLHI